MGWATVPPLTAGFGASGSFVYAAVKHRRPALGVSGVLYGIGSLAALDGIVTGGVTAAGGVLLFLLIWVVSTIHAMVLRPKLYPPPNPSDQMNARVVEMARHRRSLREEARKVVAEDPGLARELRIGRPDLLPRPFDDGGLVDVNHVPPEVLSRLPGLTYEMVDRIMAIRTEQGGFVSAEELAVHADLPPSIVAGIAEYAIFVR
jgi:hypothetical protein